MALGGAQPPGELPEVQQLRGLEILLASLGDHGCLLEVVARLVRSAVAGGVPVEATGTIRDHPARPGDRTGFGGLEQVTDDVRKTGPVLRIRRRPRQDSNLRPAA